MTTTAVRVTREQARIIRDFTLEPVRGKVDVDDLDGEDWRGYFQRLRDEPSPRPAHYSEEDWAEKTEQVRRRIDETTSLLDQLEHLPDAAEVTLTLPRHQIEQIGCGLANVALDTDRREIRAGLDLLDQLQAR